jgi:hypothetical protein
MAKQVRVRAVMTTGRHEISYARTWIDRSLRQAGVPLAVSFGVYYGQLMQRMFEDAIKDDLDFVVTVDGDSVFTGDQVHRLICIAANENMDAVASMQVRRGIKSLLGFKKGQTSAVWDGTPIEVDAAHFGLTVLNVKKLAITPKPWFYCKPDDKGEWGEDHIDSDVWFWQQWKEAGNKLYIDPGCRIGHVEEMVVMHNEDMVPTHYYPKDWDAMMMEKKDDTTAEGLEETSSGKGDRCPDPRCRGSACQSPEDCPV